MSETKKLRREIDSLQGQIDRDRERLNHIEEYLRGLGPALHMITLKVQGLLGGGDGNEESNVSEDLSNGGSSIILPPGHTH